MSFSNEWVKLLILEVKPGRQLNSLAWNNYDVPETEALDYMEYATDAAARAAYVPAASEPTGGTITTSGTKRIHTFTAGGTFALPAGVSGNVEVLVVAGGGGGAGANSNGAGGGGGGEVKYSASLALSAGESVAVTVGAGGAGGVAASGSKGGNSVFKSLTAEGGGYGALNAVGGNGGCGGGGGGQAVDYAGGTGGDGGDGGSGHGDATVALRSGGGGGGAGPNNGGNGSAGVAGNGGNGYASSISGASVTYAGGGGGASQRTCGAGGTGGGTDGSKTGNATDATDGLGGGGGGAVGSGYYGGDGGDGVVIVSYVREDFKTINCYSEATIKTQGSYSLKVVGALTGSLNQTATRTVSPTVDLSGMTEIKFDIRASRTGSNVKIGIHDSGGTTTEVTPNVASAGAWQTVTWDISAVADADKDAIDSIVITIVNADAANTIYIDNLFAEHFPVWYLDLDIGEVVEMEVDGVALTKKTSLSPVLSNPGRFYHDFFGGRLWVRLADDSAPGGFTSPDYDHDVIAFVWRCFSNRQGEPGETVDYVPEDCAYPHYYEPALRQESLAQLDASVADHFESSLQITFGSISIVNDLARWYAEVDDWLWGNKDARILIGQMGDAYADLTKVFVGKVKSPAVSDEEATFELVDSREGRLQSIPPDHFSTDDYANLDPDAEGRPVPILFGMKSGITPARIDTAAFKFKVSATHFNGGADVFEMESIDAVYHKGVTLTLATHYTVDLHNGEFTLLFDPGDGEVTCDAKGIKDEFLFDASPFGSATGNYSENVADHLYFILHVLNGIPEGDLDLGDFAELQAVRTQAVAWYLDEDTATLDFNRLLQQTSLYHFLPLGDGTLTARYYRKSVPAGTLELYDWDHAGFRKSRPNDGVFRDIFLRYDKNPTTGEWKQIVHSNASTEYQQKTKDPYVVDTALRADAEAASVLAFYVQLLKQPPTKIETTISMVGHSLVPTDKLYVSRAVVADGLAVPISQAEVYVILETRKNFADATIQLVAQRDDQLAIYTVHADEPHQDVPHVDHSDTVHTDDAHGNSHTDTPYVNHTDNTHSDSPYRDYTYDDKYYDDHDDIPHSDSSYTDHDDVAYHDHPHVDTGHVDHSDTVHEDSHTDVPHVDSEV